jgi:predicted phage-related endonuclease
MEEIKAEVDSIRDSIKAEMLDQGVEELEVGTYIVRWTSVLSNRFDTTSFKKVYGDLYKSFTKQVNSKRFCISC